MKKRRRYGNYIEERSGVKYARVYLPLGNGKYKIKRRKLDSIGEGTPLAAKQWALLQLDTHKNKIPVKRDKITFTDAALWYAENKILPAVFSNRVKVEGIKDFKAQRDKIKKIFIPYFADKKLREFSDEDLKQFARFRRLSVTQTTVNRDLSLLRPMFKEFHTLGWIEKVLHFDIITAAETERDRILTFDEEKRLLDVCVATETIIKFDRFGKTYKTTIKAKREHLRPIVICLIDTALRLNELLTLKWSNVNLEAKTINVEFFNAKTERARKVPITSRLKIELEKLDKTSALVFPFGKPTRAFTTACKRAKIEDLHIHDLRATCITRLIRAGVPHTEVMKISGHQTLKMLLKYLNPENEAVKNAASRLDEYLEGK